MHRLRKLAEDNSVDINTIYFEDDWKWIENDNITNVQYVPTLNKEWQFERPLDYPEWTLQSKKHQYKTNL